MLLAFFMPLVDIESGTDCLWMTPVLSVDSSSTALGLSVFYIFDVPPGIKNFLELAAIGEKGLFLMFPVAAKDFVSLVRS